MKIENIKYPSFTYDNNRILYDEENIKDVERHIKENKIIDENGRVFRMLENPGTPCDVKITEKSRKILTKTLLK